MRGGRLFSEHIPSRLPHSSRHPIRSSLRPASLPPADVVVVDENVDIELESGEELNVQGSELIAQLRAAGFTGVACVLTGAHRDRVLALSQLEGVDLAFEKHVDLTVLASELLQAYACRPHAP
jgi:hypothetical protein